MKCIVTHYKVVGCIGWEEGFSPKSIMLRYVISELIELSNQDYILNITHL